MGVKQPEYGPPGYLPERAARRARKIVLREQMGRGWPLAAIVAGVVVAGAGLLFVVSASRPPGPPYEAVAPIAEVEAGAADVLPAPSGELLVVRRGAVRAFAAPEGEVAWCANSGRIEADDGRVWAADGRLVGGDGRSLQPLRSTVFDGTLYVDPTARLPVPTPDQRGERPACD